MDANSNMAANGFLTVFICRKSDDAIVFTDPFYLWKPNFSFLALKLRNSNMDANSNMAANGFITVFENFKYDHDTPHK